MPSPHFVGPGCGQPLWAALLVTLLPALAGADEVYKSVDAQGHVTYSDRPISTGAKKTEIEVQPADPAEAQRLAKERLLLKEEDSQRKKQQAADDRTAEAQARVRQQRCAIAQRQYNEIKDVARIYKMDADGNKTYLTDAEADAQRERARQAVQTACAQ